MLSLPAQVLFVAAASAGGADGRGRRRSEILISYLFGPIPRSTSPGLCSTSFHVLIAACPSISIPSSLSRHGGPIHGRRPLLAQVRGPCENDILLTVFVPKPVTHADSSPALSSRGLGHRPLKAETRVRIPLALPTSPLPNLLFGSGDSSTSDGRRSSERSVRAPRHRNFKGSARSGLLDFAEQSAISPLGARSLNHR